MKAYDLKMLFRRKDGTGGEHRLVSSALLASRAMSKKVRVVVFTDPGGAFWVTPMREFYDTFRSVHPDPDKDAPAPGRENYCRVHEVGPLLAVKKVEYATMTRIWIDGMRWNLHVARKRWTCVLTGKEVRPGNECYGPAPGDPDMSRRILRDELESRFPRPQEVTA